MKILYVEDDLLDADLAQRELSRHAPHINLSIASNLSEARTRLAEENNYDLVLSDLNLPDGSGLDLLEEIRDQALPVAVVILTGLGDEETAVAALKSGADDYLAKRKDYLARLPLILETALDRFRAEINRKAHKLRVLYVERHSADADLAHRHLARHSPHIHLDVVQGATEAFQLLPHTPQEYCPYDVLLMDYSLPGLNALELLKSLKNERQLDLPVVLVTGQGNEDVAVQALRLGASDYLVKHPGYLFELPTALENAYHRAQLAQEQAALQESEARFRRLAENAQDMIYRIRLYPERRYEYMSPAVTSITGYTPEEHYADPNLSLKIVYPDDRPLLEAAIRGETSFDQPFTLRWTHKDGAVIWIEERNVPIYDQDGNLIAIEGIARNITNRKETEEALQASLQEKDLLLRELLHRTKNNMQVISAILSLQSSNIDDEQVQRIFRDTRSRIQSMALVHEKLYQSQSLSRINMAEYMAELSQLLLDTYQTNSGRISLEFETEPIEALIDIAVPSGLILNELIANALEHAFPGDRTGKIRVGLRRVAPGELMLEVTDNGVGVPGDINLSQAETFGLQTAISIAEYQLRGRVVFETENGVTCRVQFRDDLYNERV